MLRILRAASVVGLLGSPFLVGAFALHGTVPAGAIEVLQAREPKAELFAEGIISTDLDELNAAFSPDGQELYYSLNSPQNGMGVIVVSRLRRGRWSTPDVASFSGQYSDYDPFFSVDGSQLFFISNRPAGPDDTNDDYDIWVVERGSGGWGAPTNLGAPVNTDGNEFYPSVSANGTLYFSARREGGVGNYDVYRSRFSDGAFSEPENLGDAVNGRSADIDNYISPDEGFLVFASYGRPDALGSGDLYVSYNRDGEWTPARNLGPEINSVAREYCPIGAPDGEFFYWTSKRGFADKSRSRPLTYSEFQDSVRSVLNGEGNIYRIPMSALHAGE